jgi:hypothetical protein
LFLNRLPGNKDVLRGLSLKEKFENLRERLGADAILPSQQFYRAPLDLCIAPIIIPRFQNQPAGAVFTVLLFLLFFEAGEGFARKIMANFFMDATTIAINIVLRI